MKRPALSCILLVGAAVSACDGPRDRPPPNVRDAAVADAGNDGGANDAGMTDAGTIDTGMADAGQPISIPDPGTEQADWGFSVNFGTPCCDTPETAYPVGIVTDSPGYIQGNINMETGDFFYVFRTGATPFELAFNGGIDMEYVHLHDGTGLVFGDEVPALESHPAGGRWNVEADTVYVLEMHSASGGFF